MRCGKSETSYERNQSQKLGKRDCVKIIEKIRGTKCNEMKYIINTLLQKGKTKIMNKMKRKPRVKINEKYERKVMKLNLRMTNTLLKKENRNHERNQLQKEKIMSEYRCKGTKK